LIAKRRLRLVAAAGAAFLPALVGSSEAETQWDLCALRGRPSNVSAGLKLHFYIRCGSLPLLLTEMALVLRAQLDNICGLGEAEIEIDDQPILPCDEHGNEDFFVALRCLPEDRAQVKRRHMGRRPGLLVSVLPRGERRALHPAFAFAHG